jgi:hypothetical protein
MKIIITFFLLTVLGFSQSNENEVQEYLRKVKAGEAGQNPKDQALARSGDERAIARMRLRAAMNEINSELSSNQITPEIAEARRARAQASHDAELIAIETREMQSENQRELQRIRQELERTRQLKRNR